jgi:hypothetical protein
VKANATLFFNQKLLPHIVQAMKIINEKGIMRKEIKRVNSMHKFAHFTSFVHACMCVYVYVKVAEKFVEEKKRFFHACKQ